MLFIEADISFQFSVDIIFTILAISKKFSLVILGVFERDTDLLIFIFLKRFGILIPFLLHAKRIYCVYILLTGLYYVIF